MMGAIRDPPPTPVRPTSAPTPKPAAQLIQFIVISTLVVHASVGYRTDGPWMHTLYKISDRICCILLGWSGGGRWVKLCRTDRNDVSAPRRIGNGARSV